MSVDESMKKENGSTENNIQVSNKRKFDELADEISSEQQDRRKRQRQTTSKTNKMSSRSQETDSKSPIVSGGSSKTKDWSMDMESRLRRKQKQHDRYHHDSKGSKKDSSCSSKWRTSEAPTTTNNDRPSSKESTCTSSKSNDSIVISGDDRVLKFKPGDWIENRYKVHRLVGKGAFGKCLECYDKKYGTTIALKVVKGIKKYRDAAKLEIDTLQKIRRRDPQCKHYCIHMIGWFNLDGFMSIRFPLLGKSVFNFMQDNLFRPFQSKEVQHIGEQLLEAVRFLHKNKITHTDLKPENMLFVDSSYSSYWCDISNQKVRVLNRTDIKLIDFGSATFENEHHGTIVSTRHYRALEIILQLGWSYPCDMWSCGCIIFELFTGDTLFKTHDDLEHLAMIERILGKIPRDISERATKVGFFRPNGQLSLPGPRGNADEQYVKENCKPLKAYFNHDRSSYRRLYSTVSNLLLQNADERATAKKALELIRKK